jgi:hypothetical protein
MPYVSGGFANRDGSVICKEGCHVELKRPWREAADGQNRCQAMDGHNIVNGNGCSAIRGLAIGPANRFRLATLQGLREDLAAHCPYQDPSIEHSLMQKRPWIR